MKKTEILEIAKKIQNGESPYKYLKNQDDISLFTKKMMYSICVYYKTTFGLHESYTIEKFNEIPTYLAQFCCVLDFIKKGQYIKK